MTTPSRGDDAAAQLSLTELAAIQARLTELGRERDRLAAALDCLVAISASLRFDEILQTVAQKVGEAFGLEHCSVFLAVERDELRLVASRAGVADTNQAVDLKRSPELARAVETGETVFVLDARSDPLFYAVRGELDHREVRSIVVVPVRWRRERPGAVYLRIERETVSFDEGDVRFCQTIADLTARALRHQHRFEAMLKAAGEHDAGERTAGGEHAGCGGDSGLPAVALLAYLRRLLDRYASGETHRHAEGLLAATSDEELERLVGVTLRVIEEEAGE